jgi:hypothetical protein
MVLDEPDGFEKVRWTLEGAAMIGFGGEVTDKLPRKSLNWRIHDLRRTLATCWQDLGIEIATTATRGLMDEYPNATFVVLAGALHPSSAWSQCGRDIVARFIRTRRAGDTSCASVPGTVGPAVSDFPVWAAGEAPAHPIAGAGDRSNRKDRLAAAAAVHAITDAVIQVYEQPCCPSTDTGPGLRGGEFDADYTNWPHVKLVLRGVRFVRDVAEWGHIALNNMSGRLVADVKIRGAGTAAGHLHIVGYFGSSFATFTVHGRIGGRWVVVTVPAN